MNLLNHDLNSLNKYFLNIGESNFRATQVFKWIYKDLKMNFEEMTNISKKSRLHLEKEFEIKIPNVDSHHISKDGTVKLLMYDPNDINNKYETIYIPEKKRGTLCISSQVGCALTCKFCETGMRGFNRNLKTWEIVGQIIKTRILLQSLKEYPHYKLITNVVFMGMGEPLLNYENLLTSLKIILEEKGLGFSRRKVTVSTSGVVPKIKKLKKDLPVSLAISLHGSNDSLRSRIMPINNTYNVESLIDACEFYLKYSQARSLSAPRPFITIEYIMINKINDFQKNALELVNLLDKKKYKINLINFNRISNSKFEPSTNDRIKLFKELLSSHGFVVTVRKARGDDTNSACGQLSGDFMNKIKLPNKTSFFIDGLYR